MNGDSVQAAAAQCAGRSAKARCFALLLALLVVLLQPRAFAASAAQLGASAARVVAKHSQRVESTALRADAAVRVAPAPPFDRAPCLPARPTARAWPNVRIAAPCARVSQRRQLVSYFHSKRRIPRMNSDEPPRA
jgi:hypothetical protein